ncbi:MAG: purine-nucleoside phosphorylase [Anaerolineae bacterium]
MAHDRDTIESIAAEIGKRSFPAPQVGVITGSGLAALADSVRNPAIIPYEEIPHFPRSTVAGHPGRLVLGTLEEVPVAMLQGRAHFYEGVGLDALTLPVRVVQALGARLVIVTNAAGGLNEGFQAGDLMVIRDHIFFPGMAGHSPLRGSNDARLGPRFPAMGGAYDPRLRALAQEVAQEESISLQEGVYVMLGGPTFETPAEIRLLKTLGADAVGMSTAPEAVVARHGGMRVLGFSVISNMAIEEEPPTTEEGVAEYHQEVLEVGARAAPRLEAVICGVLRRLGPE